MKQKSQQGEACKITRRSALKYLAAGTAGLMVAPEIVGKQGAGASAATELPSGAAQAGKVFTRNWPQFGNRDVSVIGLGCMRFPQRAGRIDQDVVNQMVDYALEHGINYFDTAPAYGQSEVATGIALKRHPRESYMIATKMSLFGGGGNVLQTATNMFEQSLKNLHSMTHS